MKARLAKKLAHTPINWLAPHWRNNIFCSDRRDARLKKHLSSGGRENRENNVLTKI